MEQNYKEIIKVETETLLLDNLMIELTDAPLSNDRTRFEVLAIILKKIEEHNALHSKLNKEYWALLDEKGPIC